MWRSVLCPLCERGFDPEQLDASGSFVPIADAPQLEMLRPMSNGRFGERRHAALLEVDRLQWAVFSRVQMAEMPRFALT